MVPSSEVIGRAWLDGHDKQLLHIGELRNDLMCTRRCLKAFSHFKLGLINSTLQSIAGTRELEAPGATLPVQILPRVIWRLEKELPIDRDYAYWKKRRVRCMSGVAVDQ